MPAGHRRNRCPPDEPSRVGPGQAGAGTRGRPGTPAPGYAEAPARGRGLRGRSGGLWSSVLHDRLGQGPAGPVRGAFGPRLEAAGPAVQAVREGQLA